MRKNMKIPREKEKPEQPVIISRITRLPAWFEPTRSNQAEEMEMYGRLMNGSIARSRTKGSPRWREKSMMIACSSNQTYLSHYISCNIHGLEFT
jgi:hypothetical protein